MFPSDCFALVDFFFISILFRDQSTFVHARRNYARHDNTRSYKYRDIYAALRVSEVGEGNQTFVQTQPINFMLRQSFAERRLTFKSIWPSKSKCTSQRRDLHPLVYPLGDVL